MPDCQMCWNDWPSLTGTPFPLISPGVEVCRNCARSMKQVIAFTRHHGVNLVTGEIPSDPQAGPETLSVIDRMPAEHVDLHSREEEPPSPPAKQARKAR